MKILSYTASDLKDAATRRAILGDHAVFTEAALVGLTENPRAKGDDALLFIGQDQGRSVGILGMIPDTLFLRGEKIRFAWTHKWAALGGKIGGAGALLFLAAARVYQDQIGVSGCTEMAEKIFRGSRKLIELQVKWGASFYIKTNAARVVPEKYPRAAELRPLLQLADRSANLLLSARAWWWERQSRLRAEDGSTSVYLDRVDPETARFIEDVRRPELFRRGPEELHWIKGALAEPGREDRFVRVHARGGRIAGFLYLAIQRGTLTAPHVFCREEDTGLVARAILRECAAGDARDILVYDRAITAAIGELGFPILYQRPRRKVFLISKRYAGEDLSPYFVHDGDGDAFFG
jgi:hypothetical protein